MLGKFTVIMKCDKYGSTVCDIEFINLHSYIRSYILDSHAYHIHMHTNIHIQFAHTYHKSVNMYTGHNSGGEICDLV